MNIDIDVVYEDNHIIVVNKPFNTPSQEDETRDMDMLSIVKAYVKVKYNKPGDVFIGLIHRIDRPAGGLMVFARTSKAASRLSEQLRQKRFNKIYLAVVEGECIDSKTPQRIESYIKKDTSKNKVTVFSSEHDDAKFSSLEYMCVSRMNKHSLLKITLETGRPHQIRSQMASVGMPLYGDQKYGNGVPGQQLALWSHMLFFEHPVSKETLTFESFPNLEAEPWRFFSINPLTEPS